MKQFKLILLVRLTLKNLNSRIKRGIAAFDDMKIPYQVSNTLVRGLEYYTETVFEIVSDHLGAQAMACGGGVITTQRIGWLTSSRVGFGIERTVMLLDHLKEKISRSWMFILFR